MVLRLLPLSDGRLSLEFDPQDHDRLRQAIGALYGAAEQNWVGGWVARVTFGGATFAYRAEWDDPCIVANSPEGANLLKNLYAFLIP